VKEEKRSFKPLRSSFSIRKERLWSINFRILNAKIMALTLMASLRPTNVTRTVEHWVVFEPIGIALIDLEIVLFHAIFREALSGDTL
jgi:hypothetical protein